MKIKITNDENAYLDQMFGETMNTYNYLKTDILLYLIYGENIKWTYFEEEKTFYIKRGNDLVDELGKSEWKEMFTENSISIDQSRTNISIKAPDDISKKFINLLEELDVKFIEKKKTKLNKILAGEKEDEDEKEEKNFWREIEGETF